APALVVRARHRAAIGAQAHRVGGRVVLPLQAHACSRTRPSAVRAAAPGHVTVGLELDAAVARRSLARRRKGPIPASDDGFLAACGRKRDGMARKRLHACAALRDLGADAGGAPAGLDRALDARAKAVFETRTAEPDLAVNRPLRHGAGDGGHIAARAGIEALRNIAQRSHELDIFGSARCGFEVVAGRRSDPLSLGARNCLSRGFESGPPARDLVFGQIVRIVFELALKFGYTRLVVGAARLAVLL